MIARHASTREHDAEERPHNRRNAGSHVPPLHVPFPLRCREADFHTVRRAPVDALWSCPHQLVLPSALRPGWFVACSSHFGCLVRHCSFDGPGRQKGPVPFAVDRAIRDRRADVSVRPSRDRDPVTFRFHAGKHAGGQQGMGHVVHRHHAPFLSSRARTMRARMHCSLVNEAAQRPKGRETTFRRFRRPTRRTSSSRVRLLRRAIGADLRRRRQNHDLRAHDEIHAAATGKRPVRLEIRNVRSAFHGFESDVLPVLIRCCDDTNATAPCASASRRADEYSTARLQQAFADRPLPAALRCIACRRCPSS